MRRIIPWSLLCMAAFAQDEVRKISPEELKDLLGQKVFFLDVRSAKEIEELGTVKGYVNIPVEELEKRLNEIPKDRQIITA